MATIYICDNFAGDILHEVKGVWNDTNKAKVDNWIKDNGCELVRVQDALYGGPNTIVYVKGIRKWEVSYVYTDYEEGEEPELFHATFEGADKTEAYMKAVAHFMPIEVIEIKEVK